MPPNRRESQYGVYYPVALKLTGRKVVVIGGNDEAARKAAGVLDCEAHLVVISARPHERIRSLAEEGRISLVTRGFRRGDLEGAFLAIACEEDDIEAIRTEAAERGVLLNVLDQIDLCDFIAMATFSREGLQLAVHSSGKSAALSRRVSERLRRQLGQPYSDLTRLLGELRPLVHEMIPTAEARRTFWLDMVNDDLLDQIESDGQIEADGAGKGLTVLKDLRKEILARAEAYGRSTQAKPNGSASGNHDAENRQ